MFHDILLMSPVTLRLGLCSYCLRNRRLSVEVERLGDALKQRPAKRHQSKCCRAWCPKRGFAPERPVVASQLPTASTFSPVPLLPGSPIPVSWILKPWISLL